MSKKLQLRLAAIPAVVLATSGAAHAALPEGITTAITTATGDLATAASAIIVGMLAFWGLAKLGRKMGWW